MYEGKVKLMQDLDGNCEGLKPMMVTSSAEFDPGLQWDSMSEKRVLT
jgi:hypothetical protein